MLTAVGFRISLRPWFSLFILLLISFHSMHADAQPQKPLFPVTQVSTLPPGNQFTFDSGVAVGDFNGDGMPDIVFTTDLQQTSTSTVTVLLNQGGNTPPVPVVTSGINCGTGVAQPVVADMNNDKNLDLLFPCGGYIAVMLGNGHGGFGAPAYTAVSGVLQIAQPIDLNGDGYPDVAVLMESSQGSLSVDVFLNKGSSAPSVLGSPTAYPLPAAAGEVSIAGGDFNGDGKQDVLAASGNINGLSGFSALFGNGDGTLQAAQPVASGAPVPGPFITADFNHDGITDVAYVTFVDTTTSTPQSFH